MLLEFKGLELRHLWYYWEDCLILCKDDLDGLLKQDFGDRLNLFISDKPKDKFFPVLALKDPHGNICLGAKMANSQDELEDSVEVLADSLDDINLDMVTLTPYLRMKIGMKFGSWEGEAWRPHKKMFYVKLEESK